MAIINELTTDDAPETPEAAVTTTPEDAEASKDMASEGPAAPGVEAEKVVAEVEQKGAPKVREGAKAE
jgi:hypothetical protein